MKEGMKLVFVFSLVLILCLSIVSAGFWSNIFGSPPDGGDEPNIDDDDPPITLRRGDLNKDTKIDNLDVTFFNLYLYHEGPAPDPLELADVNGVGGVTLDDMLYLVRYLSPGGPAPISFETGDMNWDGEINQIDVDFLTAYLFQGGPEPSPLVIGNVDGLGDVGALGDVDVGDISYLSMYLRDGEPAPVPFETGDVSGDGKIDKSDVDFLTDYLFYNGLAPDPLALGDVDGKGVEEVISSSSAVLTYTVRGIPNIDDLTYLTMYASPRGPAPVPLSVSSDPEDVPTCTDSDGGKNYYVRGEVISPDEAGTDECCDSTGSGSHSCPGTGNFLHEWYCDVATLGEAEFYNCPNGCEDGVCIIEAKDFLCDKIFESGPKIQPRTRVEKNGMLQYCDPFSLRYKAVKGNHVVCTGDYECNSNTCIDGLCTSIRQELQRQANLLEKIWCFISNGLSTSNDGYLSCIGDGVVDEVADNPKDEDDGSEGTDEV